MPKHNLQKSLQDYLSKIKRETGKIHLSSNSFSSSKNWVLSGCKRPKTLSFSINRKPKRKGSSKSKSNADENDDENDHDSGHAATLSDIDRFLEENFKSLCIRDEDDNDAAAADDRDRKSEKKKKKKKELDEQDDDDDDDDDDHDEFKSPWGPAMFDSPKLSEAPPDLCKSERFFAAAGSPELLTEEARPSMATTTTTTSTSEDMPSSSNSSAFRYGADDTGSAAAAAVLPENCIAVLRYTPEPYEDFRRSMLEMVEARLGLRGPEVDWDFMEELLFCYLDLNDKRSHRFILSAFVDLIIVLRQNEKTISRKGLVRSRSTRAARERLRRKMKQRV